ncbi:unnamed protein product [Trichobilharzia regenti]|nr:unnamed protein product [Trichobilharzia regenti]
MARCAKLAQNRIFQNQLWRPKEMNNKIISLIPDFLVYLEQLKCLQLENAEQTKDKHHSFNRINSIMNGVKSIREIKHLNVYLQGQIGSSIDPKGLRGQLVSRILNTLDALQDIIANIRREIITPLYQITPGCETQQQLDKKSTIKVTTERLFNELNAGENENASMSRDSILEVPLNLQYSIREEYFEKYGWMLCLTTSVLNILNKIDFDIDEYFQLGCITDIVSKMAS